MPAIAHALTRGTAGTSVVDAFEDAQCTSAALANGDDFLVIGMSSFRVEGASLEWSEMEGRFGTTRLGLCRWEHAFDQFNAGDSAAGGYFAVSAVVTGDGSSTLNMRVRCQTAGYPTVRYGGQVWRAINLSALTEDVDYWRADSASGDTAEGTTSDDDLIAARVTMNGSVIGPGEPWLFTPPTDGAASDAIGPTFLLLDVQELTASVEYTIQWEFSDGGSFLEGDADGQLVFTPTETGDYFIVASSEVFGTGTAYSFRRTRVFVFRLAAFSAAPFIMNAGGVDFTNSGGGDEAEGANALTHTFGTNEEVCVFGFASQYGANNWSAGYLRQQGSPDVDSPDPDGYTINTADGENDFYSVGQMDDATVTGSTSWNLVGQVDSGGTVRVGRNNANSADSPSLLLALVMQTAAAPDVTLTPDAEELRFRDGAPTLVRVLTLAPSMQRLRVRDGAPTLVQALTLSPASQRIRLREGAPSQVAAVTLAPASQRMRFQAGAASLVLGGVTVSPASERMRFQSAAPSLALAYTASPASQRIRFREGSLVADPVTLTPGTQRLRFRDGSPTLALGAVVLTPSSQRIRFRDGTRSQEGFEVGTLTVVTGGEFGVLVSPTPTFGVVLDVD